MFGGWLLDQIALAGLTRSEFIARVGYSKTTVSQWIANRNAPSAAAVMDIARVLRCRPEEVLYAVVGERSPVETFSAVPRLPPRLTVGEARLVERTAWAIRQWSEEMDAEQHAHEQRREDG